MSKFKFRKLSIAELTRDRAAQAHMVAAAVEAAKAANAATPALENTSGGLIFGRGPHVGSDGPEPGTGALVSQSAFWHLIEYGTANIPAAHPIERGLRAVGLAVK